MNTSKIIRLFKNFKMKFFSCLDKDNQEDGDKMFILKVFLKCWGSSRWCFPKESLIFFILKKLIHLYSVIPNDVGGKKIHTSMVLPCIQELFSRNFLEQKFYKTEISPSCHRAHLFCLCLILFYFSVRKTAGGFVCSP